MGIDLNNIYHGLVEHLGHEIRIVGYGDFGPSERFPENVSLECETCGTVLLDADRKMPEPKHISEIIPEVLRKHGITGTTEPGEHGSSNHSGIGTTLVRERSDDPDAGGGVPGVAPEEPEDGRRDQDRGRGGEQEAEANPDRSAQFEADLARMTIGDCKKALGIALMEKLPPGWSHMGHASVEKWRDLVRATHAEKVTPEQAEMLQERTEQIIRDLGDTPENDSILTPGYGPSAVFPVGQPTHRSSSEKPSVTNISKSAEGVQVIRPNWKPGEEVHKELPPPAESSDSLRPSLDAIMHPGLHPEEQHKFIADPSRKFDPVKAAFQDREERGEPFFPEGIAEKLKELKEESLVTQLFQCSPRIRGWFKAEDAMEIGQRHEDVPFPTGGYGDMVVTAIFPPPNEAGLIEAEMEMQTKTPPMIEGKIPPSTGRVEDRVAVDDRLVREFGKQEVLVFQEAKTQSEYIKSPYSGGICPVCSQNDMLILTHRGIIDGEVNVEDTPTFFICKLCFYMGQAGVGPVMTDAGPVQSEE